LLFAAEAHNRLKDTSCTSQPCAWLSPNMKNVACAVSLILISLLLPQKERGSNVVNLVKNHGGDLCYPLLLLRKELMVLFMDVGKQGNLHCCLFACYCDKYVMDHSVLLVSVCSF